MQNEKIMPAPAFFHGEDAVNSLNDPVSSAIVKLFGEFGKEWCWSSSLPAAVMSGVRLGVSPPVTAVLPGVAATVFKRIQT